MCGSSTLLLEGALALDRLGLAETGLASADGVGTMKASGARFFRRPTSGRGRALELPSKSVVTTATQAVRRHNIIFRDWAERLWDSLQRSGVRKPTTAHFWRMLG